MVSVGYLCYNWMDAHEGGCLYGATTMPGGMRALCRSFGHRTAAMLGMHRSTPRSPWRKCELRASDTRTSLGQLNTWYPWAVGSMGVPGTVLHVDHNHDCCPRTPTCGQCTRGVLCTRHNVGLEVFLDSPSVVTYLLRTAAGRKTLADNGLFADPVTQRVAERQVERRR